MPKKRGSEIQIARGRLKGVLQELVAVSEDEPSEDESEKKYNVPLRGRPPKKLKKEKETVEAPSSGPLHESFVMKLFDRSLDLAKYKESTPLYPICRAWIANKPRSSSIKNLRNAQTPSPEIRVKCDDIVKDVCSGRVSEIQMMPPPSEVKIPRAPSPLPEQKLSAKNNEKLGQELKKQFPHKREDLLQEHVARWVKVKNKWNTQTKAHHQRYALSYQLLETLFKQ